MIDAVEVTVGPIDGELEPVDVIVREPAVDLEGVTEALELLDRKEEGLTVLVLIDDTEGDDDLVLVRDPLSLTTELRLTDVDLVPLGELDVVELADGDLDATGSLDLDDVPVELTDTLGVKVARVETLLLRVERIDPLVNGLLDGDRDTTAERLAVDEEVGVLDGLTLTDEDDETVDVFVPRDDAEEERLEVTVLVLVLVELLVLVVVDVLELVEEPVEVRDVLAVFVPVVEEVEVGDERADAV